MNERDKQIIKDIERFRALHRDQLIDLHFIQNKEAKRTANFVLNRLRDKGYIKADESRTPFVYLPSNGGPKRRSQKIDHFIEIANVYLKLRRTGKLRRFDVEPKLGDKGTVEPDVFAIWRRYPWFIEVQLSNYSDAIMRRKLKRYEDYYKSGQWKSLDWQPKSKNPIFPRLVIISNRSYDVTWLKDIRVLQAKEIGDLVNQINS